MVFRPNEFRNKDGIGMPADDAAVNTTDPNALVALAKGIFGKLGGGTSATVATDVAQGSTTSGQTGGLVQGAVTTAAPTYVTGKTNPLSLETDGDLRTHDAAATAILSTLNLSTDGLEAALGIVTETAPATDTASSGLNGRLQRIAQRLTSLIAQIPATLGVKARTASLSVALSTEDAALLPASVGAKAAASSFAVTSSTEDVAQVGSLTETAPASDTASSGLNGRLQRIAQRITSLIALVPTSLGAKTAAGSFSVTTATDDNTLALFGAVTETAPASDTASSGLNGRAQRVAQRLTSLIALVPASLGTKAAASSFAVALSTEDTAKLSAPTTGTQSNVASSATDVTILASNAARKGATVFNDSTATLYLLLANTTSSATVHTVQIAAAGYYELPISQGGVYTGIIKGIWSSATGSARVTELT